MSKKSAKASIDKAAPKDEWVEHILRVGGYENLSSKEKKDLDLYPNKKLKVLAEVESALIEKGKEGKEARDLEDDKSEGILLSKLLSDSKGDVLEAMEVLQPSGAIKSDEELAGDLQMAFVMDESRRTSRETEKSGVQEDDWSQERLMSDMLNLNFDDFECDMSDYHYEGFDPNHILDLLKRKALSAGIPKDTFNKDMKVLSCLVVLRGTNKKNLLEKSTVTGAAKIERLIKRYSVEDGSGRGGKSVSRDTILLSRILACFPANPSVALIVEEIKPKCLREDLPIYLHHSAAASMIPRSDPDTFNRWLIWSKDHDKLINGDKSDETKVASFGNIIWNSNYLSETHRVLLMRSMKDGLEEAKRKKSARMARLASLNVA